MGMERGTALLPANDSATCSTLRKLKPTVKVPSRSVLEKLSASERSAVRRRVSEPVECMFDVVFEAPGAEQKLRARWDGEPSGPRCGTASGENDDSGVDLLAVREQRVPAGGNERHMFLWLNYCRYRVMQIVEDHAGRRLPEEAMMDMLRWERAAGEAREDIVRCNLPLVLAMAKRARLTRVDFADLVSEGNLALLRSVDKFDCRRGYKFSTYACRAILKSFSRVATRAARYRGRFPTEFDPLLEKSDHLEQKRADTEDDCVEDLRSILGRNLADLSDVEQQVIKARFALDAAQENGGVPRSKTLEQVGEMIGVTKERVRQIQNKALGKLREILEEDFLTS